MVLSFPFSLGFGLLCVLGSLMSISSCHWLGVWLGLELNMIGFLPLMVQASGSQAIESAVKYFIVQALGSSFLLLGGLSVGDYGVFWYMGSVFPSFTFFCVLGLLIKLGVSPFHWWVPSVMGGLGWFSCGVLITWQKLAPFFVLLGFSSSFLFLFLFFGFVSSVVGGFMGIGQVQLRFLLAYSSISHWGWVVALCCYSVVGSVSYFFFYYFLTVFIIYMLGGGGVARSSHVGGFYFFVLAVGFTSLGGLPPLTGFLPKWLGLQCFMFDGGGLVVAGLILGSLLSLYYYLTLVFVFFIGDSFSYNYDFYKFLSFSFGLCFVFFVMGFPFFEVLFFLL
uniref:NADH-ubiquinone oxidoreductase chain 2 n=1 Tax=Zygeupolia rubens TaxID=166045 RepID=I1SR63_9BILA|nr:NADH dehydrogenase subunit 2 [Zygeupolia rubens]ADZ05383.1 NADH dehydrogenase subunit 2 [Zygeupolia rubens]